MKEGNSQNELSSPKKLRTSEKGVFPSATEFSNPRSSDSSDSGLTRTEKEKIIADAALSNFVVLRNIFSILSDYDLESCCHVSQYWRSVADPFVITHYDIRIGKERTNNVGQRGEDDDPGDDMWMSNYVVIKEGVRYNRKRFKEYESNFEGATNALLEEVLQTHKISISLAIFGHVNIFLESVKTFLAKFGPFVHSFGFAIMAIQAIMGRNQFCKFLLQNFPNLERLNCSNIQLTGDTGEYQNFSPDLPENQLKHLKRIYFPSGVEFSYQPFLTILKIAPKLEVIDKFPIHLIQALVLSRRADLLKSVSHPFSEPWFPEGNEDTLVTAFEKLAQLAPKLRSFIFLPTDFWPTEFLESVKPHTFSILQSSSQTLEKLILGPSESYGFQSIPELKSLKTVIFSVEHVSEEKFFPTTISLQQIFPNVTTISIDVIGLCERVLNHYFPAEMFSPWGSQIEKLKIGCVSVGCVPLIHRLFPALTGLSVTASTNTLEALLPAVSQLWPQLESLTIDFDYSYSTRDSRPHRTLDSLLTGIPEDVVTKLKDPLARDNFTVEEIQGFRTGSVISKLSKLTSLKLILRNRLLPS